MKSAIIVIVALVAFVAFALAWRKGAFLKFSAYVDETKQELYKCTWPTWQELGDSTKVVCVAIALLGLFTFVADRVFYMLITAII